MAPAPRAFSGSGDYGLDIVFDDIGRFLGGLQVIWIFSAAANSGEPYCQKSAMISNLFIDCIIAQEGSCNQSMLIVFAFSGKF